MKEIKIYFASKRHWADKIKGYRREGFHFCARWLETANLPETRVKPASHWMEENFDDIMGCHYVIVYAEKFDPKGEEEHLKTALIEVGWAMAYQKPIIVVGLHQSYIPWRANKQRVTFAPSIEDALLSIKRAHTAQRTVLNTLGKEVQG